MRISESPEQLLSLLLVILSLVAPLRAQQQKQPPPQPSPKSPGNTVQAQPTEPKEEEATFDTVLAAGSYKVYGEIRMIGQLARSNSVTGFLEPARLLGAPPKEVTGIIEFLNANAETLATSRVMFATTPARPAMPPVFVAVEMASPEDALKLEPKLRAFLSSFSASTPGASTAQTGAIKAEANNRNNAPKPQANAGAPTSLRVFVKRAGSLLLMSDTSFTLKSLRPDGSAPLSADQNFQKARSRFASEALFIYYDVKLVPHVKGVFHADTQKSVSDAAPPAKADKSTETADKTDKPSQTPLPAPEPSGTEPENLPSPGSIAIDPVIVPDNRTVGAPAEGGPALSAKAPEPGADLSVAMPMLGLIFGGGAVNWPEAVGVAVALEGDEVVVRATMVNAPGTPNSLVPFFPFLVHGPEIAPGASALSPVDTDLFVSVSVDATRTYDAFLKMVRDGLKKPGADNPQQESESVGFENQIAIFEQALGFKIKEDLLGALGNEVAINVPYKVLNYGPNTGVQTSIDATSAPASQTGLALFISLNDKERVREMLPRVLEVIGLKAPGMTGQTEKRGGVEITSYGTTALAFIDDFLVISTDIAALRSVADAHENNQTLSSSAAFKNATGWQSSRVLGQVYLSSEFTAQRETFVQLDDKLKDFLARFNPKPAPITHAAFNDPSGLFHELHLPKDWVALMMAGMTSKEASSPMMNNEMRAVGALIAIRGAQTSYKEGKGKGSYATREQLGSEDLIPPRLLETEGYRIEMTVTSDKFEVTATPTEYGKTGRQSFYLNESGIIRGADHVGQPATVEDKPL